MTHGVFALDTSCMVAAACSWHERHDAVAAEIEVRLGRGERLVIPAHAILETYAVLTRLPAPHRLAAADAWALVRANFVEQGTLVTLPASAVTALVEALAGEGVGGGRTYDAVIGASAAHAKAHALLTLNRRHFEPPPRGVVIVDPAAAR